MLTISAGTDLLKMRSQHHCLPFPPLPNKTTEECNPVREMHTPAPGANPLERGFLWLSTCRPSLPPIISVIQKQEEMCRAGNEKCAGRNLWQGCRIVEQILYATNWAVASIGWRFDAWDFVSKQNISNRKKLKDNEPEYNEEQ